MVNILPLGSCINGPMRMVSISLTLSWIQNPLDVIVPWFVLIVSLGESGITWEYKFE